MSYILDALRKSEQERRRGAVPDLTSVHDPMPPEQKKHLLWPYLLAAVLLINAGLLAWWLLPSGLTKQDLVADSGQSRQLQRQEEKPLPQDSAAGTGLPAGTQKDVATPVPGRVEQKSGQITSHAGRQGQDLQRESAPDLSKKKSSVKPPVPDGTALRADSPPASPQAPAMSHPSSEGEAAVPVEKPVAGKIYSLNELPASIQNNLPALMISVSLYTEDPASRMVRINDEMVREGQYLSAGMKVEEILRDGAVLSYRNFRFRVGLK